MTNEQFFDENVSAAMTDVVLLIDDSDQTDLYSFMQVNLLEPNVDHLNLTEAAIILSNVMRLKQGESTFAGLLKLQRLN